jgi:hypothetical protein
MRRRLWLVAVVQVLGLVLGPARAATPDLTSWFLKATAYNEAATYASMAKPDFLGGTTWHTMPCPSWNGKGPHPIMFAEFWQMVKYDPVHRIALAGATTDQCSSALFIASKPPFTVPSADLSQYGTGRRLRIGSTVADVVATYGKTATAACARHCVLGYKATTSGNAVTTGHPLVQLPELVTVVVDQGRVSAISMTVNLGGLF